MLNINKLALGSLVLSLVLIAGCKHTPKTQGAEITDSTTQAQPVDETMVGGAGSNDSFKANSSNESLMGHEVYHFDFDSTDIKQEDAMRIQHQGAYLAGNPGAKVRLEGHTDERGSREYNMALGHRRADSVKRNLESQGANSDSMDVVSYGAERPAVDAHTEEAFSANRRVELSYTSGAPQG